MISLNNLKNDSKNEINQNVNISVSSKTANADSCDVKVSYPSTDERTTIKDGKNVFDYHDNILPMVKNEYYSNLTKMFAYYIDILNSGKYKKEHGQNILYKKDYLEIIELLTKTYITNNEDCNIKMFVDECVGCFANNYVIDSISCSYNGGFIDIFNKSAEIVNILQMMKIDKQRIIN